METMVEEKAESESVTALHCSFCHKSKDEVTHLVQSIDGLVYICDECVWAAYHHLDGLPKNSQ